MRDLMVIDWSDSPTQVVAQAIGEFQLRKLGWQGFENLGWVLALHSQYPEVHEIAMTASSRSTDYLERLQALLDDMPHLARQLVTNYFAGKLALEELSCQSHGPGAGMCDRRTALMAIWQHLKQERT